MKQSLLHRLKNLVRLGQESGPESPHSTWNLHASQVPTPSRKSKHRWVKWLAANSKESTKLDEDIDRSLESISKGNADQKLQTIYSLIMSKGAEGFGVEQKQGAISKKLLSLTGGKLR